MIMVSVIMTIIIIMINFARLIEVLGCEVRIFERRRGVLHATPLQRRFW